MRPEYRIAQMRTIDLEAGDIVKSPGNERWSEVKLEHNTATPFLTYEDDRGYRVSCAGSYRPYDLWQVQVEIVRADAIAAAIRGLRSIEEELEPDLRRHVDE